MFLQLSHTRLDVYQHSLSLVKFVYAFSRQLPPEERFNLTQQIRRAVTSVHLNISEGSSRRTAVERRRFFEMSRGSIVELDAAFDICEALGYCTKIDLKETGEKLAKTYQCLSGLINACKERPQ